MTFTVLAYGGGDVGVATASFVLAVGARVPVVVRGKGAAAVQGETPLHVREAVRDGLHAGRSAPAIVEDVAASGLPPASQLGVLDAMGGIAVHRGPELEAHVAVAQAPGLLVIANLMERADAADAALRAAAPLRGRATLPEVLLAALAASDARGGDLRGRMSAALVVEGPSAEDLRVDRHPRPIPELQRLHEVHLAHAALERTRRRHGAYRDLDDVRAAHALAPEDPVCLGALLLALVRSGAVEDAVGPARALLGSEPRTAARLRRAAATGDLDPGAVDELLRRAREG